MVKTIFITGATSGIGKAAAKKLSEAGHRLILNGRRVERLSALEKEIQSKNKSEVLTLPFDVRNKADVAEKIQNMPIEWKNVDVLINNAGLSRGLDPIHEGKYQDWEEMIDTNVKGLLFVTREITPGMVQRKTGQIINVGSIAGKETYANGNVYCSTKYAVDALTKAMRIDLLYHNIKVTAVNPGAVETEFSMVRFHGDISKASNVYKGYDPLKAEDIADIIEYVIQTPPHVNINDVIVMPTAQANTFHFNKKQ